VLSELFDALGRQAPGDAGGLGHGPPVRLSARRG
jgi:hypothetical protein